MKRKQQNDPPLMKSIERRIVHLYRHITLYPATPDLLYYMLTEIDLFREEMELIRETLPCGIEVELLFRIQIQVTTIENELHRRLAEATQSDRNQVAAST